MSVISKFSSALDFILGLTVTGKTVEIIPGGAADDSFGVIATSGESEQQLVIENIPVPDDTAVIEIDLYDEDISEIDIYLENGYLTLMISRSDPDLF